MKKCTECGGAIEDSRLHDFHYVIGICVKVLQARVEKSEAAAVEFAKERWDYTTEHNPQRVEYYDHNKFWFDVSGISDRFQRAVDYLVSVGNLEQGKENPSLFRWTPSTDEASKQQ